MDCTSKGSPRRPATWIRTLPGASWRSAPFRVYWRFGKPRGGVSACAPLAVPALLIAGPLIPVASAISTQDESIKRNAAPQRLWVAAAARNTRTWSKTMAQICDICGKKPMFGNNISHAHNVTRRRWNVNLQAVKALVNGAPKRIRVCASCIKSGKIAKA